MGTLSFLSRLLERLGLPRHPPYSIYSTRHDEVISAADLLATLPDPAAIRAAHEAWLVETHDLGKALSGQAQSLGQALQGQDVAISLLVDHSGSMKGDNQDIAALVAQACQRLADAAGADYEVLGFTTVDWQGKPVRAEWRSAGSPLFPGRLCAARHIVYRSFGDVGEADLALMTAPDVLRENVDGEALLWAASRLRRQPAPRRILVILSDGAPVDDSTLHENQSGILWRHYRQVVDEIRNAGDIRLAGIGINHDLAEMGDRINLASREEIALLALPFLHRLIQNVAKPA